MAAIDALGRLYSTLTIGNTNPKVPCPRNSVAAVVPRRDCTQATRCLLTDHTIIANKHLYRRDICLKRMRLSKSCASYPPE